MRLLSYDSGGKLCVSRDLADSDLEPYAILSHTWLKDEDEITYSEVGSPLSETKPGYSKIKFCGNQVRQDGLHHFWVDTCCIDKTSSAELSEAITSMYHWYQRAQVCYVYLADVSFRSPPIGQDWQPSFRQSRWFTRGWTLQELLAPQHVVFYSEEWDRLGTKDELKELLHDITGISILALEGHSLSDFPVVERMRWTRGRRTKKKEDEAYCLLGIFGVSMTIRYGHSEGDNAFRRLQRKLDARSHNRTLEPAHDYSFQNPVGLCLGQAPSIKRKFFFGRDNELEEMAKILLSSDFGDDVKSQRCLVLGGMGGVGKTQLALAYAQRHPQHYDSIFWLNATSEATLMIGFQAIAKHIFSPRDYHALEKKHLSDYVHSWFSCPRNTSWLMIFDNYDEPQTYDIRRFYPGTAHGTIIVTTRRADLVSGEEVRVKPLSKIADGLRILQTCSGRVDIDEDVGANDLVKRLAGLPLALATAGTFLRKSVWTFQQYLNAYEERWNVSGRTPLVLIEYQDRTLYTTWDLSYDRLKEQEPDAAKLLQLFAYFDYQAIWYDLLRAGIKADTADWLFHIVKDSVEFESIMRVLVDYCFVETQSTTMTYSIHTCVHDWVAAGLNRIPEPWSYCYAFHCVASSIKTAGWYSLDHVRYTRFTPHAVSLMNARFTNIRYHFTEANVEAAEYIAQLLQSQAQLSLAGSLLTDILTVKEKSLGTEHLSTLCTVLDFGNLYSDQGKLREAEQMYLRSLAGKEKALGKEHRLTLNTVDSLGNLYLEQGKLVEAEQMYLQALVGKENALGVDHTATLGTVNGLGLLYFNQGKVAEAEQMYLRALAGYEKALGTEHKSTLITVHNLGLLYRDQGQLLVAEQMYLRALTGMEKELGMVHPLTLSAVHNLGGLYADQGKLAEAEQMYLRALAGMDKALGAEHTSTLKTLHSLGVLYADQAKLAEAEQMYLRALAGMDKALGAEHTSTLTTVNNLGTLYYDQGKLVEAEQMYLRAIAGREKVLGAEHTSTLHTVNNLGLLYNDHGKLAEAEQAYLRVIAGKEKALGAEHMSTLHTVNNLGLLYFDQGKLAEAEQTYLRALAGMEKTLGAEHISTLTTIGNLGLLYCNQGKMVEAEQMQKRALVAYGKNFNEDHPRRLKQMLDYADFFLFQLELGKARHLYQQIIDTCAKSLPGTTPPSPSVATTYIQVLSKMVGILESTSGDARPYLRSLIKFLRQEGRITITMVQCLAKALLHVRDDENIQLASFQHMIHGRGDPLDLGGTRCDACYHRLNTDKGMNICRQCVDTNLCDVCLSTHRNRMSNVPKCQHDQFYDFGEMIRQAIRSPKPRDRMQMDTWLDDLARQYATTSD